MLRKDEDPAPDHGTSQWQRWDSNLRLCLQGPSSAHLTPNEKLLTAGGRGKAPVPGARPGIAQPPLYFRNKGFIKSWPLTSSLGARQAAFTQELESESGVSTGQIWDKESPCRSDHRHGELFKALSRNFGDVRKTMCVCVCVHACVGRLQGQVTGISELRGTQGTETDGHPPHPGGTEQSGQPQRDQESL